MLIPSVPLVPLEPAAPCGPVTFPALIVEALLNVIIKLPAPLTLAFVTPTPVAPVAPVFPCAPIFAKLTDVPSYCNTELDKVITGLLPKSANNPEDATVANPKFCVAFAFCDAVKL